MECVYLQEIGRLSGRLREQARSHIWIAYICQRLVGCQAAFAGKPRSYSGMWVPEKRLVGRQAAFAGKPRAYKGFGVNASLFTTHQAER